MYVINITERAVILSQLDNFKGDRISLSAKPYEDVDLFANFQNSWMLVKAMASTINFRRMISKAAPIARLRRGDEQKQTNRKAGSAAVEER